VALAEKERTPLNRAYTSNNWRSVDKSLTGCVKVFDLNQLWVAEGIGSPERPK